MKAGGWEGSTSFSISCDSGGNEYPGSQRVMECILENITLHYEMMGEGRPLIVIHGWGLDHRYMASSLEPVFTDHPGWKRIYPDLPGMGQSPAPDWLGTQDQMLDILLRFIEKVIPGQRFVVAGASYGGYLARGLIHHKAEQIDGLLLIAATVRPGDDGRTLPGKITIVEDQSIFADTDPKIAKSFQNFAVIHSKKYLDEMRRSLFPAVEIADHKFLERLDLHPQFSFDVDRLPAPFTGPTLILTGRQDSTCGYVEAWGILENFPRGTFVVLDRAGHGLAFEQETLFRVLTGEWLDRVQEGIASQT